MKKEIIQSIARTTLFVGLLSGAGCEYYTEAPVSTEELEKNLDLLGDQIAGIPTLPATTEGGKSSVDEGLVADLQQKLSAFEEQIAAMKAADEQTADTSGADEALIAGFQEKIKALEEQIAALTNKDSETTETEPADTTGPEGIKPWDFQSKAGPWVWTTPGAMAGVKKSIPNPGTEDPETSEEGEPTQPTPENNLKKDSGPQMDGADLLPGGETNDGSFIEKGNKAILDWLN